MLKNARTEFENEAKEIATYRLIDAMATAVGDKDTATLARRILREEQRMADFLGGLIPQLAVDAAHDEIPVAEIEGPAARRTAGDGATAARRTTTASRSGASRSGGAKAGTGSGRSRSAASKASGSTAAGSRTRSARSKAGAKSAAKTRPASRKGGRSAG